MKKALYYENLPNSLVKCTLCPQNCVIPPDKKGFCKTRINTNGELFSENYGKISSIALDPIEKKPLYRYHPGKHILSVGTKGCNLKCMFCQNWSISQSENVILESVTPAKLIEQVKKHNSFGIAYTYNEPFIWYEFVLDCAKLAKENQIENALVTNGFVNEKPLEELLPFIDAMNVDLKAMDNKFYKEICGGTLEPVLNTIKKANEKCHIEITNLIIPTLNDSKEAIEKLVDWIYVNCGETTPLHFSRYFPCYKMDLPITPLGILKRAEAIARNKLKYVYLGNI